MKILILITIVFLAMEPVFAGDTKSKVPRMTREEAKKQCLKENPDLKGKSLQQCIKKKRHKKRW
ncbi:MAG: hypothetical protein A2X86_18755 [Bdellovibrionales bacterium GWA2_49_15]|nr:MAG: hypothetical protein A2X86_18755 [Bdellovibrionales bacterium GWA2_49_15]HAZ14267.1 hypothetical protein [Bdellovibrionales bacterium]